MLVIRLQRTGRRNAPAFRLVVTEHSMPVKGRFKEIVGHYLPTREPAELTYSEERISHWISQGALPSNTVARLLAQNGMKDMEKYFKQYTKQRPRKEPPEEAAPPPPAQEEAPAAEEVKEEAPATEEPQAPDAPEEKPAEEAKEEEKKPEDDAKPAEEAKEEAEEKPDTDADEGDKENKE